MISLNKVLVSGAIAATLLSGGAAASLANATQLPATPQADSCTLTEGTLTWGVKESFRSYISGGIARGSWELVDGASYTTPNFMFSGGTGSAKLDGTAAVNFAGGVNFTGHGGILDLRMANPTVRIDSAEKATLLLDMRSNDMSGNLAVDEKQVALINLNIAGALTVDANTVTITAAPATMSASGVAAFSDFYEEGVEFDPVTFTAKSTEGCAKVLVGEKNTSAAPAEKKADDTAAKQSEKQADAAAPAAQSNNNTGLIIAGIVAAIAVICGTTVAIFKKRGSANK